MKIAIVVFSSIVIFLSAAGIVAIRSELRSDDEKNHELAIASMDKCSEGDKTRLDPIEWTKCVEYSSGYAPLEKETRYLDSFVDFHSEVRRRLVKAACIEDPIVHYRKKGFKNPRSYLFQAIPLQVRESLLVEKLKESGIKQDDLGRARWNWAKSLGASDSLNRSIQFSGSRSYDNEREFALDEYLEQLRRVIYRSRFKEEIASVCPEKLTDLSKPMFE